MRYISIPGREAVGLGGWAGLDEVAPASTEGATVRGKLKSLWLSGLALVLLAGCEPAPVQVRALPGPQAEQPAANLPASLHLRNWTGPLRQGSCVHASLTNHLRWLNEFELGERWRSTYSDGEYASRLMRRLDAAGIDYSYTLKADPRFLDWGLGHAPRRNSVVEAGPLLHLHGLGPKGWPDTRCDPGQQSARRL